MDVLTMLEKPFTGFDSRIYYLSLIKLIIKKYSSVDNYKIILEWMFKQGNIKFMFNEDFSKEYEIKILYEIYYELTSIYDFTFKQDIINLINWQYDCLINYPSTGLFKIMQYLNNKVDIPHKNKKHLRPYFWITYILHISTHKNFVKVGIVEAEDIINCKMIKQTIFDLPNAKITLQIK